MKKSFLLFAVLLPLLFISCDSAYFTGIYDCNYINNSSRDVTVTSTDGSSFTVASGVTYTGSYNSNETYTLNTTRVTMSEDFNGYNKPIEMTISDAVCIKYAVFNSSNYSITLTENNGMIGDNDNDIYIIPAGETVTVKVYTTTPSYTTIFTNKYTDLGLPVKADLSNLTFTITL